MIEKDFIAAINKIQHIATSNASDEMKYDRVFQCYSTIVKTLIKKLGLSFDYYDPDTSYAEDMWALVNALLELKNDFEKTLIVS